MGLLTWLLGGVSEETNPAPRPIPMPDAPTATLPEGVDVVGESFHDHVFRSLDQGNPIRYVLAVLRPEPQNRHDRKAIGVYVAGQQIGHLSREQARARRTFVEQAIYAHGCCAVEAVVFFGEFPHAILSPRSCPPLSRVRLTGALLGERHVMRTGEPPGFTMREEGRRWRIFWSGDGGEGREENIPEMARTLRNAGYAARVARERGYPYISVTGYTPS